MEFSCEFVYAPQPRSPQKHSQTAFKKSALLPPLHKVPTNILRPCKPPPPPPYSRDPPRHQTSAEHVAPKEDLKRPHCASPALKNAADLPVTLAAERSPKSSPGERRRALLPPPMKLQRGQPCSHPFHKTSSSSPPQGQGQVFDPPKQGQGSSRNCSYGTPDSTECEKSAPMIPPNSLFMTMVPEYTVLHSSPSHLIPSPVSESTYTSPVDKEPLPGNPNVILVALGKLVAAKNVKTMESEPCACAQCGSVMESFYDNVLDNCYFCQSWKPLTSQSSKSFCSPMGYEDCLFLLNPENTSKSSSNSLIIFCIDTSRSMNVVSEITADAQKVYKSRLQCVQQGVMQCVQSLNLSEPNTRIGLVTFNNQVHLHGYGEASPRILCGALLTDRELLEKVGGSLPSPPTLSESKGWLEQEIHSLSSPLHFPSLPLKLEECGSKALGPAVLVAISMASRQAGSKVVICTDGKASTGLGTLSGNEKDSLVPSYIFYQDLGDYAASQGVMVSVLTLEGTNCRLDELGKLADRTGGEVVIASPGRLCAEFQQVTCKKTAATHCTVTLMLPTALCVRGEKETEHRGIRHVGNVTFDTEITFQFVAREKDSQALLSAGQLMVQLQVRYRQTDGRSVVRVLSAKRRVTGDRSLVLSSLSVPILQLNISQSSAALALRGRHKHAKSEAETQMMLMKLALDVQKSTEQEEQYKKWVEFMDPILSKSNLYMRTNIVSMSDIQALTDEGAALLFAMKNGCWVSL